jgi:hypothetical protein
MTVAQVLDVIEATRSGSSAKKRHAVQISIALSLACSGSCAVTVAAKFF